MSDLFAWLEASAAGRLMRETGAWTYPLVNLAHVLGIASLFGAVLVLDLRLLGLWRGVPLAALAQAAVPVARVGFILAALAGVGLLADNATDYVGNPYLLIKFVAIALGLANAILLSRSNVWHAELRAPGGGDAGRLALMGGVSLASWATAIATGRLIGYW